MFVKPPGLKITMPANATPAQSEKSTDPFRRPKIVTSAAASAPIRHSE